MLQLSLFWSRQLKLTLSKPCSLLEALCLLSPGSSKNTLRSWIAQGRVFVNGNAAKDAKFQLQPSDLLELREKKKILKSGIEIIYEDSDLVVIDKPSGLLSVAAAFEKEETARGLLKKHYSGKQVFAVHRLDQDTSGLMLFALNQETCEKLKKLFEIHDIERAYTALVEGEMKTLSGTWKSYLYEDATYRVHETKDAEKGKIAISHYRVVKSSRFYSLIEVVLETGRKNQIRVHCQSAGHPIAGDKKYGAKSSPIKRLALHAHLIGFKHPSSGKMMRFERKAPESFQRVGEK